MWAFANSVSTSVCGNLPGGVCSGDKTSAGAVFGTVANVMIYIIGGIAVVMIVVAGLRFVLSGGNADSARGARETILYAAIGLVVAIMAYAVVNTLFSGLTNGHL